MAKSKARSLLRAAVGVATVSYVAGCDGIDMTSGNLVAPTFDAAASGTGSNSTSGNLAPPPSASVSHTGVPSAAPDTGVTSGNLMPPDTGVRDSGIRDTGVTSGNLMPPDTGVRDAAPDTGLPDAAPTAVFPDTGVTSGNLMPPPDTGVADADIAPDVGADQ